MRFRPALLLAITTAGTVAAGAGPAAADVVSFTTAGTHPFTVPAQVHTLHVVLVGGRGGRSQTSAASPAGNGARVEADVAVTPGQQLFAVVGGNGAIGTGGANGGGAGGVPQDAYYTAGGGGGASDLRTQENVLASRLLVAGGGGGAGISDNAPGGDAGQPGQPTTNGQYGVGGGAGTATAGGSGGAANASYPVGTATGRAGSLGLGGAGGQTGPDDGTGGGGGGGWYGGGGGGAGQGLGASGGGGSSYAPGGSVTVDGSGTPLVSISYTPLPAVTVSTTALSFPGQAVGVFSAAQSVTIANAGPGVLHVGTPTVDGPAAGDFAVADGCTAAIAANASCVLSVRFGPGATGGRQATLRVPSDGDPSPLAVALVGTGVVAPGPAPIPAPTPITQKISAFSVTQRSFRVGTRPPGASRTIRSGTTLRLTLAQAGTVRFSVARLVAGRKVGRTCRTATRTNRRRPACTRATTAGTFTSSLPAGASRVAFSGRLRGRSLARGTYRITAAVPGTGASAAVTVHVVR